MSREDIERHVDSRATSVDGRHFSFQTSLHGLELQPGSYVTLGYGADERLGQVVTLGLAQRTAQDLGLSVEAGEGGLVVHHAAGTGVLLDDGSGSFHDALMRAAFDSHVADHVGTFPSERRAALAVGDLVLAPGVALRLDGGGFSRHTFLCGQSGSGKSYALGVLLERLLLETGLRVVVLDPNSDFVRVRELRPDVDDATAKRFAALESSIVVRRAGDGLGLRFPQLSARLQAAVLRLDPIADREEYAELLALVEGVEALSLERLERLSAEGGESARRLVERARNLGVSGWGLWAGASGNSVLDDLERPARCVVVDVGSLATREEQALTVAAVLDALWERRARREPTLIVLDEAHNACPAHPADPLTAIATEHAVRIAGEGRKYGLYLLASTQRPQKVHENVLSQCDNLLLMRMNSLGDLGFVGDVFSFVPTSLVERATDFRKGESLVAGLIAPHAALVRIGRRFTAEGGGDVPDDWARSRE